MINYDEIKENFNGKIYLGNQYYFFDVEKDVLKIFFNESGINSVAQFNRTYFETIKKGFINGICEDEFRVILGIMRYVCLKIQPYTPNINCLFVLKKSIIILSLITKN